MSDAIPLRPFSRGPVPLQTAEEAGAFDREAIEETGVPQPVLMENAGRSAALVGREIFSGGRVVALVGSGNNGGDALVVARTLTAWGYDVEVVLTADRSTDDPLLHGWDVPVVTDKDVEDDELVRRLGHADFVVDGILGTGVRGAPRERQARVIRVLNGSGASVLALDVPSGVDASTGAIPGVAVRAAAPVSFGAPKLGALLHPGRDVVGRHVTVEIGFPPLGDDGASAFAVTPEWAMAARPLRASDTHKNRVGRVVVVGGGPGMAGAGILAGQAAFRAGAGLVQLVAPAVNRDAVHGALPEAIFVDWGDADAVTRALEEADAVAAGPGLGTDSDAADVLRRVVATGSAPLLLDADALNLASEGVVDLPEVAGRRPLLLTPHPGEMARLHDPSRDGPEDRDGRGDPSRPDIARSAARRFGCAVLFKGAPSLVAAPDTPLAVDTQTSSDLAVAGMGDTLTGVCAALMAQGLDAPTAGALGLYVSGRAARLAARGVGLVPSDVAERVPEVLSEEGAPETELDLPFVLFDADPAR